MAKRVVVPLAEGFEEIEAITIIDVLKRAGVEVVVAGLTSIRVCGGYAKLKVGADTLLQNIKAEKFDMIVLPGGMPGSEYLAKSSMVKELIDEFAKGNKLIAAICAAPWALNEAGVLEGEYTCYPSCETMIKEDGYVSDKNVVINGNVMTSRGPATAICFALEIVKKLVGVQKYDELKSGLLADYC